MLTLTAFNGDAEQHRARILGILATAGLPGLDESVDHALGFPGAVVELEALPAAFQEPFYVFTTHNELEACLFISPEHAFSVSREDILHELSLTNVTHGIDAELLRCLVHPDIPGKLLIIDWGRVAPSFGPAAEDRIKPETLKTIANKLSLKLTDEFEAGKYHFGLLFEK
ncbi:MAG: hypothetical protein UY81_C0082G0002 [Candidatus Giovannonibacteria bacterium GW2011_GWA2_53_7]|uniref:Uncharacterized protein n=1 Tax=Candidatus Giovannonibacteria bacterium GW2011_GWA2_53_7 TaxID=1618650 RepID=A0A0G2AMR3_9BACT|nr:MAG: hypothetical protein UY81_C0082G0002 [Candidatus Giovannonibacteria bacterium GW2011_GWA2_53_7]